MSRPKIQHILPLTPLQEGILFHHLKNPQSEAYFEQVTFSLRGDLDIDKLVHSLEILVQRHDILRTVIVCQNVEKPRQIVLNERKYTLFFEDISERGEEDSRQWIETYEKQDRKRGFNLSRDILFRLAVFRTEKERTRFVISFHHIILDGWSLGLLLTEFFSLYQSLLQGVGILSEKNHTYRQYIRWLLNQDPESGYRYWKTYLADLTYSSELPWKNHPVSGNDYKHNERILQFDSVTTRAIQEFAMAARVSLNIFIQGVWGILLQRYTGRQDVVFGTVVSGRHAGLEKSDETVGLLINTIPVRVKTCPHTTISELLSHLHAQNGISGRYDYCSLADIQSKSGFNGSLFDHILVFENYIKGTVINAMTGESHAFPFQIDDVRVFEQSNYDLNILVLPGEKLFIKIFFNEHVFSSIQVERILHHIHRTVLEILACPNIRIRDLDILPAEEKKRLTGHSRSQRKQIQPFVPLHVLFEKQVLKSADRSAVTHNDLSMTYAELNRQANQWARVLRSHQIGPGDIVGIRLERSIALIMAMLAVVKSGAAYLPVDVKSPAGRVRKIMDSSGMRVMLTHSGLKKIPYAEPVCIEIDQTALIHGISGENLESESQEKQLLYVIYTSGSTGEPKGVMIEQRGFQNLLENHHDLFRLMPGDRCSQSASPAFDAMAFEIWPALTAGAEIHILPETRMGDPYAIHEFIESGRISFSYQPTVLAEALIQQDWQDDTSLRFLVTAGDRLKKRPDRKLPFRFFNLYGPTEDTVWTTVSEIMETPEEAMPPDIGKPLQGHEILILDHEQRLQPAGIPGELCIGGQGLARGYLNDEPLTLEKFIGHPFRPGERLYRTGDLACWTESGRLRFLGRSDFQVKIGGQRIELGEIENQLIQIQGIDNAVVLLRQSAQEIPFLCACYTADSVLSEAYIQDQLSRSLPHYMIPRLYLRMDTFPLNEQGKMDRKKLQAMPTQIKTTASGPENETEALICEVWKEILGISQVDPETHFFNMGGNSLHAIQVQSKLARQYAIQIQDLYNHPTVTQLARFIRMKHTDWTHLIQDLKAAADKPQVSVSCSRRKHKMEAYLNSVKNNSRENRDVPETDAIFLTGATGFLGAHLLHVLLNRTEAHIHCLVRGEDVQSAYHRLNARYQFYFDESLDAIAKSRLHLCTGDISKPHAGLNAVHYERIIRETGAIIHAAADVRHFGDEARFNQTNVGSVSELVQMAVSGKKKRLHHISTLSLGAAYARNLGERLFTEHDESTDLQADNPYLQSKIKAESCLFEARKQGLDVRIYRVGNLMFQSQNGRFQVNIQENAFYRFLRALLRVGLIPDLPSVSFDFSFIDFVSNLFIDLFLRSNLENQTFHLFNPRRCGLQVIGEAFNKSRPVSLIGPDEFFNRLLEISRKGELAEDGIALLSYLSDMMLNPDTEHLPVCQQTLAQAEKTVEYWPEVNAMHLRNMLVYGETQKFW